MLTIASILKNALGRIYRAFLNSHRSFLQCFGKCRVTVNGAGDILRAGTKLNSQHAFGDHVRRPRPDDVHPQDAVGLFVSDYFDKAFGFSHTARPSGAGEGIGAGAIIMSRSLTCSSVSPTLATSGQV